MIHACPVSECSPVEAAVAARPSRGARLQAVMFSLALCSAVPALAALTVNPDGTVTDSETGLTWDRCSWGQTGTDCLGGTASSHTWSDALGVALIANTGNYKGHDDWRLPNVTELESILDLSKSFPDPTIDLTVFPNTNTGLSYWSSTVFTPTPSDTWAVFFDNGAVFWASQGDSLQVRLVRGGQSFDLAPTSQTIDPTVSPIGSGGVACLPNPAPTGGSVTCTATPGAGFVFGAWGGDCAGQTGPTCTLNNVSVTTSVTVTFAPAGSGPQPIPALGPWWLALLSGLVGALAWGARRQRGQD